MTTTDWIIDIVLVLIVVRQIREERLTWRFVLLPLGIVAFVAHRYLQAVPSGGNDLALIGAATGLGLLLGLAGGALTHVRGQARAGGSGVPGVPGGFGVLGGAAGGGVAFVRAGWAAATLWVASMGARLGFIIWISHSAGQATLGRFSAAHGITSADAWTDALVLLALAEVTTRIALIAIRGIVAAHRSQTSATTDTGTDRQLITARPA